ncbi:thermonuclease family protein [Salinibacter altiplanensis]|uniref:thermonuclease family protein n=1 Tax=Salinibacter altiplanensis TaxID=1803181 RepID=UPI001F2C8B04|nr:thermonuclease family protein [Salinibacter altiplanensis]
MRYRPLSPSALSAAAVLLFVGLGASNSSAQESAPVEPEQTFTGRVADVTDGDTFDVERPIGDTVTVQLWGVDAPEFTQPYGDDATRKARKYVGDANVRVEVKEIDTDGRAFACVQRQGVSLARLLVNRGVVWHADYTSGATKLARLERQARNVKRGLWTQESPVPPWTWRSRRSDSSGER